jgi:hypothetical protein
VECERVVAEEGDGALVLDVEVDAPAVVNDVPPAWDRAVQAVDDFGELWLRGSRPRDLCAARAAARSERPSSILETSASLPAKPSLALACTSIRALLRA